MFELKIRIAALLVVSGLSICCYSQIEVNHWETIVYDTMKWKYKYNADPGINWQQGSFNDSGWLQGNGGFGYGDNDDNTIINSTLSVFLRKKFTVSDRSKIIRIVLSVDYDDGFIAYLNGVEIARAFMGTSTTVPYTQGSNGLHEASLYQGQPAETFLLTEQQMDLLVQGENILAVQVHNENIGSSDLTSNVFLSVGISDNSFSYLPVPSWFIAPQPFESSNLPIISINTNGNSISDEPRIVADMGVIFNGEGVRNSVNDSFNNYSGKISIETKGESSQMFPKKSFRFETQDALGSNLNVSLLGLPPENDWILYAPFTDKTLMRDVLTFKMGNDMGRYAPRTKYVELILNGSYEGIYVLMEKIKVDKNRVNISSLKPTDISGVDVTGGYLLRVDKLDPNDFPGWQETPIPQLSGQNDITFQYYDPNGEDLVDVQRDYIRKYIKDFQSSLTNVSFTNSTVGYRRYLDISAAIDFMIVNEIGKNIDGYVFSTYLYKEKDKSGATGKLVMGPLWDFNLAFGNVDYLANAQYAPGWMWDDQYRMFWFRRLVSDPYFANHFNCRWKTLRETKFTNSYFTNTIDSLALVLNESQARNYKRWPILGTYVWPNQFVGSSYQDEINFLKQWTLDRLAWMDSNMIGNCLVITATKETNPNFFQIFPNPFSSHITIQSETAFNYIEIRDFLGRTVFTQQTYEDSYTWQSYNSLQPLANGSYLVTLYSNNVLIDRLQIIKMN